MYGWYYSWHPTKSDYDLDNSENAQVYMSGKATQKYRNAVQQLETNEQLIYFTVEP